MSPEEPGSSRVTRIEVVDDRDRVRVVVGQLRRSEGAEGAFGVAVLDENGAVRAWFALEAGGPTLVFDQGGNAALQLGVDDPAADVLRAGAYIHLADATGQAAMSWVANADGPTSEQPDGEI